MTALIIVAVLAVVALVALSRAVVIGRPDEWVLLIRNGRCVRSGVGIATVRSPVDTVARFSSTVQRIRFRSDALTSDAIDVTIDGFVIWSVDPTDPFTAYQRLGLGGTADNPQRHVLSKPQYKAFQTAIAAAAQSRATAFTHEQLSLEQQPFVDALREATTATLANLGVTVDEVQVVRVRATQDRLHADLTAPATLAAHRAAETARIDAERALETERSELDAAKQSRQEALLTARLDRERREAEANADNARIRMAPEEEKSEALRSYELSRRRIDKLAEAFGSLPMKEARWYTLGSPLASLTDLLDQEH